MVAVRPQAQQGVKTVPSSTKMTMRTMRDDLSTQLKIEQSRENTARVHSLSHLGQYTKETTNSLHYDIYSFANTLRQDISSSEMGTNISSMSFRASIDTLSAPVAWHKKGAFEEGMLNPDKPSPITPFTDQIPFKFQTEDGQWKPVGPNGTIDTRNSHVNRNNSDADGKCSTCMCVSQPPLFLCVNVV